MTDLAKTARELLESETFSPEELNSVLVERGHTDAEVDAAIENATAALTRAQAAKDRALAQRRVAGRWTRAGVLILICGSASMVFTR